jgi:hypothetical protein
MGLRWPKGVEINKIKEGPDFCKFVITTDGRESYIKILYVFINQHIAGS